MRKIVFTILIYFFSGNCFANDVEVRNGIISSIFKYLSTNRNMNLLAYYGPNASKIGKFYYVEEPDTPGDVYNWASTGNKMTLFLYEEGVDLKEHIDVVFEEKYRIQDRFADYIAFELETILKKNDFDSSLFVEALKSANVRFQIVRLTISYEMIRDLSNQKKTALMESKMPYGSTGVLTPLQELKLIDFSYDEEEFIRKGFGSQSKSGLNVSVLNQIKSMLSIKYQSDIDIKTQLFDISTFAFKAYCLYFPKNKWWGVMK